MALAPARRPQRVSLTRECLKSIREYIGSNDLGPGERLPSQQEWAAMLGVSVLVVREAFQAAQVLGLVDVQHGRGIFVRDPRDVDFLDFLSFGRSSEDFTLSETIEARAMLEFAVLEACIARATPQVIAELESLVEQMHRYPPRTDEFTALHKRFHQTMLTASGNRLLGDIGMLLINTFWVLSGPGLTSFTEKASHADMVAIHEEYVRAIREHDFSHTRDLVDRHLLGLCTYYQVFPFGGQSCLPTDGPMYNEGTGMPIAGIQSLPKGGAYREK